MAKSRSIDYSEIFGDSIDEITSEVQLPALLTDDPMFQFQEPTGAGNAICQRAEDRHFIAEISGFSETEVEKTLRPTPSLVGNLATDFVKRSANVLRKAPERAIRIREIVDLARNQPVFRPVRDKSELWAQLHQSIENYIASAVISEAL